MNKLKVFSLASIVALAIVGVFAAKANGKFVIFIGTIFTANGTRIGNITSTIPVYTTTVNSTKQAELDGVLLYYFSGVFHPLYQ